VPSLVAPEPRARPQSIVPHLAERARQGKVDAAFSCALECYIAVLPITSCKPSNGAGKNGIGDCVPAGKRNLCLVRKRDCLWGRFGPLRFALGPEP